MERPVGRHRYSLDYRKDGCLYLMTRHLGLKYITSRNLSLVRHQAIKCAGVSRLKLVPRVLNRHILLYSNSTVRLWRLNTRQHPLCLLHCTNSKVWLSFRNIGHAAVTSVGGIYETVKGCIEVFSSYRRRDALTFLSVF